MMKKKVRPVGIILSFVLLFISMLSGCQKKEEKEELRQPILAFGLNKNGKWLGRFQQCGESLGIIGRIERTRTANLRCSQWRLYIRSDSVLL